MNEFEIRLNHCIDILNSFPKDNKSLTIHVEDYFVNIFVGKSDRLFIIDVFAETIKYHKILKVIIDRYYNKDGESVFERDRNLYSVILFLIVFRMDSLGIENLRKYIKKDRRLRNFLKFLTTSDNLWPSVEESWNRLYEHDFVCEVLMAGINKWLPSLNDLTTELSIFDGPKTLKTTESITTKPEPFKLTRPKPKRVPMPDLIPEMDKPKIIPQSTYIRPGDSRKPERKDAKILLEEADRFKPACADKGMSVKTMEKLNQIVVERPKEHKFEGIKARPNPKSNNESPAIKLNTATILREWKLYESRNKKKMDELKKLEEGTFNASQFQEWQQSVRTADLAEKIAIIEKRRLEGKLSYEEAILNRENLIQENKNIVESLKRDTSKRMERFMKDKALMEERAKLQVEKIIASEEGVKEAKLSVQNKNKLIAKEIAAESKRLQEEALIEAEAEMRRKLDIISEIRALEGSNNNNQKILDPTQVAGYGLLCEMSLAELKERLTLCKTQNEEQISIKKESIQDNKQQKEKQLADTVELIELCRTKLKESAEEKSNKTVELLNSEQSRQLDVLKNELEIKRNLRKSKQNKDNNDMVNKIKTSIKLNNKNDILRENLRSECSEKMARLLSI